MKGAVVLWAVLALVLPAGPLFAQADPIPSVETPMGLARVEDEFYPSMGARLLIGDKTVVVPDEEAAQ